MISFVILSTNKTVLNSCLNSVKELCGIEHEFVIIDNSSSRLSIFEGYNLGASLAKYEYLVFVHEDVVFRTSDFGSRLVTYFNNLLNCGVLGVAGSNYVPISPSDWWISDRRYLFFSYYQGDHFLCSSGNTAPRQVFVLDGLFFAVRRSIWKEFKFDEDLKGFHGYDTDFCLKVCSKYFNYYISDILVSHRSEGKPNSLWLENHIKIRKNHYINFSSIDQRIDMRVENAAYSTFLNNLYRYRLKNASEIRLALFFLKRINDKKFSIIALLYFFRFSLRKLLKESRILW
ncbi:glycosyltransferase [Algoriphagus namhaensis]